MSIQLTESAAERILKNLSERGSGLAMRLAVKSSGCSGYMYDLDFVDEINSDDQVFEAHGARVVVDSSSMNFLDGTEIDYGPQGLGEGFSFNNPNVVNACGCGESFNVS